MPAAQRSQPGSSPRRPQGMYSEEMLQSFGFLLWEERTAQLREDPDLAWLRGASCQLCSVPSFSPPDIGKSCGEGFSLGCCAGKGRTELKGKQQRLFLWILSTTAIKTPLSSFVTSGFGREFTPGLPGKKAKPPGSPHPSQQCWGVTGSSFEPRISCLALTPPLPQPPEGATARGLAMVTAWSPTCRWPPFSHPAPCTRRIPPPKQPSVTQFP